MKKPEISAHYHPHWSPMRTPSGQDAPKDVAGHGLVYFSVCPFFNQLQAKRKAYF
jgi:hypothetical protein